MNRICLSAVILMFGCLSMPAFADKTEYLCTVEVAKGACWGGYTVNLDVTLEGTGVTKMALGKNDFDKKIEFKCTPRKVISLKATIDPPIWVNQKDSVSVFPSTQKWATPLSIKDTDRSWAIQVCFEQDFANAPRPISNDTSCKCVFPKS